MSVTESPFSASRDDVARRDLAARARRLLELRQDPTPWIEQNLFIRTKERKVVPLRWNDPQRDYMENRTNRDLILKPRQLGFSTQIEALFFGDTVLTPNTTSVMLAHDMASTEVIFGIAQLFWDRLPESEKALCGPPRYSNRREFYWPTINSRC